MLQDGQDALDGGELQLQGAQAQVALEALQF